MNMQAPDLPERFSPGDTITVNPKKPSRAGKGTQKVIDHEVKEKASALLFALLTTLQQSDANSELKPEILKKASAQVTEIVTQFGLDPSRLKTLGQKQAMEFASTITDAARVAEIEVTLARAAGLLKATLAPEIVFGVEESTTDVQDSAEDNTEFNDMPTATSMGSAETRSSRRTRNGVLGKRARDQDSAIEALKKALQDAKRLKQERLDRGSKSSADPSADRRQSV